MVWPDSSVSYDTGCCHSFICIQLVPNMGWEIQEGFIHMSGSSMLSTRLFFLHMANWASLHHGGLKVVGLFTWQLTSKREQKSTHWVLKYYLLALWHWENYFNSLGLNLLTGLKWYLYKRRMESQNFMTPMLGTGWELLFYLLPFHLQELLIREGLLISSARKIAISKFHIIQPRKLTLKGRLWLSKAKLRGMK